MRTDLFNYVIAQVEHLRDEVRRKTPNTSADPLAAEHAASDAYQNFLAGASAVLDWHLL